MTHESYTSAIKPRLVEQYKQIEKVRKAIWALHDLIGKHTIFPDDGSSHTVPAYWDEQNPDELVWFNLHNHAGQPLDQRHYDETAQDTRWTLVRAAHFIFSNDNLPATTVFRIDFTREQITDNEDRPLASAHMDGVVTDIGRYAAAIAAGRLETSSP